MPELPDVDYFRRYVNATALHKAIRETHVRDARIIKGVSQYSLARRLKNRRFAATVRHGKFLFAELDRGGWLVLHFGMTGMLTYYESGREPRHTRVLWTFVNDHHLAYQCQRLLGQVTIIDDRAAFVAKHALGPDALADDFRSDDFVAAMRQRRAAVKSALMDQSVVAGIGNIYADEILFQAGLRPDVRADQLDEARLRNLYRTMRRVLRVTARHNADVSSFPRTYLLPQRDYGRCPSCGGSLTEAKIAGRTACFCPRCQPAS